MGIDVREVREDVHRPVRWGQAATQGSANCVDHRWDVFPDTRGFQGVHSVARVPQSIAQVRATKSVGVPLPAEGLPKMDPARVPRDGQRRPPSRADDLRRADQPDHKQAAIVARATQAEVTVERRNQPRTAGEGEGGFGLGRGREAKHGEWKPGLSQALGCSQARAPAAKADGLPSFPLGQGAHAHGGPRDDAQAPFRAEHPLAHVWASGRGGESGQLQGPGRRLHVPADEELLDAAVAQGLLAARTRSDPAAQGRVGEGLRKVAQGQAVRSQAFLDLRAGDPGTKGCETTRPVQVDQGRLPA